MNILEIDKLHKAFGSHQILQGLSLSVPEHSVFGFIGQNGAGKTTTMKMILGLLKTDSGQIRVCGDPVTYGQTKTNRFIGYLPDVPEYYSFLNSREYLSLCGAVTGMDSRNSRRKAEELLELVGIKEHGKKKIGGFSRGMKQRLGIAQALLNEPRLLILDEPTSALDPVGRKEILDIISRIRDKTTVLFSTHILSDVERICDEIAILKDGKTAISGTLDEVRNSKRISEMKLEFKLPQDCAAFRREYRDKDLVKMKQTDDRTILMQSGNIEKTQVSVLETLYQNRLLPSCMELLEPTLESLFLEVVK